MLRLRRKQTRKEQLKASVVVVYQPAPNTAQSILLNCPVDELLICGSRGGGKSAGQLMHFRKYVGLGYGSFLKGIIFDREFKHLQDIVAQSKKFFYKFNDGAKFYASASEYKWKWPTGEELLFRHAKTVADYDSFHGHEYPWMGFNELTKWSTPDFYDKIQSTNRSGFDPITDTPKCRRTGRYLTPDGKPLPPMPLKVVSTTNPSGAGRNWVKMRFIDPAPYGHVVREKCIVFDPKLQIDREITRTRVAIFSSYRDNPHLPAEYIAKLDAIKDGNLRKAWLFGDWNAVGGGALDDLWGSHLILEPFNIPPTWRVFRGFDWGSSHPFACVWFTIANGEEATLNDGSKFCPPVGTLIMIGEWYGAEEVGTNKGLKMSAKNIADGMVEREDYFRESGLISIAVEPGPADGQIYDVREKDVDTIAKKMENRGIMFRRADKSPGSRVNGLQVLREYLEATAEQGDLPGIMFFSTCRATITTLPVLPRDDIKLDDVDTDAEDHLYDAVRYSTMYAAGGAATKITMLHAT